MRRRDAFAGVLLIRRLFLVLVATAVLAPPASASTPDALQTRVLGELQTFTDWLATNHVQGFIGEVGWPDNDTRWNDLGEAWFSAADTAKLWVSWWASCEWCTGYKLALYEDLTPPAGLDSPNTQATVVQAHPSTIDYLRGTQDAGGGFCGPETQNTSSFSNRHLCHYDTGYHYDGPDSFNYIYNQGARIVRIDFRWEQLQHKPGADLDADELRRLKEVVGRANTAGLKAIIEPHNFGQYYLYSRRLGKGVRRPIGSAQMPVLTFADLWTKVSSAFKDNPDVYYDLMNEPVKLPGGAATWEDASRQAVAAIRANSDNKLIMVPGYFYSAVKYWTQNHQSAWINDANIRYEAHQYFDCDGSGRYAHTYDREVQLTTAGYC